jgi:hypothetical protein
MKDQPTSRIVLCIAVGMLLVLLNAIGQEWSPAAASIVAIIGRSRKSRLFLAPTVEGFFQRSSFGSSCEEWLSQ